MQSRRIERSDPMREGSDVGRGRLRIVLCRLQWGERILCACVRHWRQRRDIYCWCIVSATCFKHAPICVQARR